MVEKYKSKLEIFYYINLTPHGFRNFDNITIGYWYQNNKKGFSLIKSLS